MATKLGRTVEAAAKPVVIIVTILHIWIVHIITLKCRNETGNSILRLYLGTCTDGLQNGDETGLDCGGRCDACLGKYLHSVRN